MLILKEGQVCPFSQSCPYNDMNQCWGAKPNRPNTFTCEYVVNGKILEGGFRLPSDKTGKMKILQE